jgi:hypothetical protein
MRSGVLSQGTLSHPFAIAQGGSLSLAPPLRAFLYYSDLLL